MSDMLKIKDIPNYIINLRFGRVGYIGTELRQDFEKVVDYEIVDVNDSVMKLKLKLEYDFYYKVAAESHVHEIEMFVTVYLEENKVTVDKVRYSSGAIDYVDYWYELDGKTELPSLDEYPVDVKIVEIF